MLKEDYKDMLRALSDEKVYRRSLSVNIEGIEVHIPLIDDLIRNKRAAGRTKDLADAEALEALRNSGQTR